MNVDKKTRFSIMLIQTMRGIKPEKVSEVRQKAILEIAKLLSVETSDIIIVNYFEDWKNYSAHENLINSLRSVKNADYIFILNKSEKKSPGCKLEYEFIKSYFPEKKINRIKVK